MSIKTNRNRTVEAIPGDAGAIVFRGQQIEDLGEMMKSSASLMSRLSSGAAVAQGQSAAKLVESLGDAHVNLKLAGERYKPTGTALKRYGNALDGVQSRLRYIVPACVESHAQLHNAETSQLTANARYSAKKNEFTLEVDPADAQEEERLRSASVSAMQAVTNARNAHDLDLADYDAQYDVWDDAYEIAVSAIGDANGAGQNDSGWDDASGFFEGLLKVLSWVGIAVTILALFVGGPIIAAIAIAIAVVTLIGTLYLATQGRRSAADIGWAVFGILPFGKVGKLFKGDFKAFGNAFTGQFSGPFTQMRQLREVRGLVGSVKPVNTLGLGMSPNNARRFTNYVAGVSNLKVAGGGGRDILNRFLGGSSQPWKVNFFDAVSNSNQAKSLINQMSPTLKTLYAQGGSSLSNVEMGLNALKNINGYRRQTENTILPGLEKLFGPPSTVDQWRAELVPTP